jgi:hypothetical protein
VVFVDFTAALHDAQLTTASFSLIDAAVVSKIIAKNVCPLS